MLQKYGFLKNLIVLKALYLFNYLIMKNFKNKIVVITVAASGGGKAYVLEF
jgi:hypothetical protein